MNILLLMSDSLVAPLAGPYGDTVGATPNLDRLAADGVVFENAYCNSPLCAPSRASMVTGRYVSDINAFDNGSEFLSEWPTMGHALSAAGYETVIVGKMHFVGHDQTHGFDRRLALSTDYTQGYDAFDYRLGYNWDQPSGGNPWGVDWMGPSYVKSKSWEHYSRHFNWDEEIHREAISYLSQKTPGGPPFFCCVSYHAPHNPFWIGESIRNLFRDKELPLPVVPNGVKTCHGPMDKWLSDFHHEPAIRDRLMERDNLRWLYETYYGIVYDLDRRIGELLELLRKQGLDKETAILFVTDHGDMLAHRGMVQKRCFYEWSSRIALIGSFPGHWQQGKRRQTPVSLVDLFPTIAECAGAPKPEDLPGRNLLGSLTENREPEDRPVFCEYHGEGVHAPCFMVRQSHFKYVHVHGHEERLYDVVQDPDEYVNLIANGDHHDVARSLRKALLDHFDPVEVSRRAIVSQRNRGFVYHSAVGAQNSGKRSQTLRVNEVF